jgi:hypothetical protein
MGRMATDSAPQGARPRLDPVDLYAVDQLLSDCEGGRLSRWSVPAGAEYRARIV